ncbi:AHH domain-containing protein [Halomonas campaniensis]|uniref:Uncharacterized protein n=1 Tax=Halomonas campaniensis TaxID=213554 RepID=A0A246S454_9GAMM|nr:hypothetical protein [Halomonas campaniensis]OWV31237.1 hypothetical protein JI62_02480 [Halomonas campaniensis]
MVRDVKHRFQIHHIVPNQLFENDALSEQLENLFGKGYLNLRDSEANKIALYRDMGQAETIKQSLLSGDNFYRDIGIGGSHHEGGHLGYNLFLLQNLRSILNAPENILNTEQKKIAFFDLARFASQVSEGTATYDGKPLSLAGGKANTETLKDAWAARQLDYTASDVLTQDGLGDFINHFQSPDRSITDATTNGMRNTEQRLMVTKKQTTAFYQIGAISEEHYQERIKELNDVGESMKHLSPREVKGGTISKIFYSNSVDKETADSQLTSLLKEANRGESSQPSTHTLPSTQGQSPTPVSSITGQAAQGQLGKRSPGALQGDAPEAPPVQQNAVARRRPRCR